MSLVYPDKKIIGRWAELVSKMEHLRNYLPNINDTWISTIEGEFILTSMHPDRDDLAKSAARLFYRIIKNHRFVDGNKRSALLNTYLFIIWNRHGLNLSPETLYLRSKDVAKSKEAQEEVIRDLAELFRDHFLDENGDTWT